MLNAAWLPGVGGWSVVVEAVWRMFPDLLPGNSQDLRYWLHKPGQRSLGFRAGSPGFNCPLCCVLAVYPLSLRQALVFSVAKLDQEPQWLSGGWVVCVSCAQPRDWPWVYSAEDWPDSSPLSPRRQGGIFHQLCPGSWAPGVWQQRELICPCVPRPSTQPEAQERCSVCTCWMNERAAIN